MKKVSRKGYISLQNEFIEKYRIDICDGSKCEDDWSRTHAHVRLRRVCKWKQANSFKSTFELLHEIGHIENNNSKMRRAEEEFYATTWAIDRCLEHQIAISREEIERYQRYVDMEKSRGQRRGGACYGELDLVKYFDMQLNKLLAEAPSKPDGKHWLWAKTILGKNGGLYYRCPHCESMWSVATNETNRFERCPTCGKKLKKPINKEPVYAGR